MTNTARSIVVPQPLAGPPTDPPADLLKSAHRLSDSAEAISTAAANPGAAAAIASALSHIETALEKLERATPMTWTFSPVRD